MSSSDNQSVGYQSSSYRKDWVYTAGCGGYGSGGCYLTIGFDRVTFYVEVNEFSVKNKYLELFDNGFQVFADGGPDPDSQPPCRLAGAAQPINVGVSVDGNISVANIKSQGVTGGLVAAPTGTNLIFETQLPQPNWGGYIDRIYITAYWGDPTFVVSALIQPPTNTTPIYKLVKQDYDVRI